jgi:hypothetical protein
MGKPPPDDAYSEAEAQRRFLGALKAGLNTPPKPLKARSDAATRTDQGQSGS